MPVFSELQTPYPVGLAGDVFLDRLNSDLGILEDDRNQILTWFTTFNDLMYGRGIIWESYTDPLITAGTGLSVDIGVCSYILGIAASYLGGTSIVDPSTTNYLWLFQNGTLDYTLVNTNPGTLTNPAIPLATIITDASSVTDIEQTFAIIIPNGQIVQLSDYFEEAWGSDRGNVATVEVTATRNLKAGTQPTVFRQGVKMPFADITTGTGIAYNLSNDNKTVTFNSGWKPVTGEWVELVYIPG